MHYLSAFFAATVLFVNFISYAYAACKPWNGNINGNPAQMCITITPKGDVTGTYFYFKYNTPLALHGAFDAKKLQLTLTEQPQKTDPETVTGTWVGILDKNHSKFKGIWKNGKDTLPFVLYDFAAHPFKTIKHEEIKGSCDFDEGMGYASAFTDFSYRWDNVISLPNPDMLPIFQNLLKKQRLEWAGTAITSNHPKKINRDRQTCEKTFDAFYIKESGTDDKSKWDESFGGYDDETTISIRPVGKYLISVIRSWSAYTGGAHGSESGEVTFYDLRTGRKVPFLDFFTKDGQAILSQTIIEPLSKLGGCHFNLNKIWRFGPDVVDGGDLAQQHDLTQWSIDYGTYAFDCTGRPGYSLEKLPADLVKRGLNPVYFDLKTKFFY